jgi:3'-5' exoribonuclease
VDYVEQLKKIATQLGALKFASPILSNPKFKVWSGSCETYHHHYGTGKLAEHTLEVAELCLSNNKYFAGTEKEVDTQLLFLSALYHDCGKMWDYDYEFEPSGDFESGGTWKKTPHKHMIHHISRSALVWQEIATAQGLSEDNIDQVLHCILSHHGQREWGSPVRPRTRMAWLLHLCDNISARMDDCDKFQERSDKK